MNQVSQKLSILIVIGSYNMRKQVARTIISLSPKYQITSNSHITISLIDNASDEQIEDLCCQTLAPWNFECIRNESKTIPIHYAINSRINQSNEDIVGVMIDGARLCSSRIIEHAEWIIRNDPYSVVSIPNYQLGECMQMRNNTATSDEFNVKLLGSINWPHSTTRDLINISFLEPHAGIKTPLFESNCLFFSRKLWEIVHGFDMKFTRMDGGFASADLFSRLVNNDLSKLFILRNEGTFHQYHQGSTTDKAENTAVEIKHMTREYIQVRQKPFALYRGEVNYYPPF